MIEAAYMIPIVLMVWMLVLFGLFYYHDKQILSGAAYETIAAGSLEAHEEGEVQEEKREEYFRKRIAGKLLFFGEKQVSVEVQGRGGKMVIEVRADARRMKMHIKKSMAVTEPEKRIRVIEAGKGIAGELTE